MPDTEEERDAEYVRRYYRDRRERLAAAGRVGEGLARWLLSLSDPFRRGGEWVAARIGGRSGRVVGHTFGMAGALAVMAAVVLSVGTAIGLVIGNVPLLMEALRAGAVFGLVAGAVIGFFSGLLGKGSL